MNDSRGLIDLIGKDKFLNMMMDLFAEEFTIEKHEIAGMLNDNSSDRYLYLSLLKSVFGQVYKNNNLVPLKHASEERLVCGFTGRVDMCKSVQTGMIFHDRLYSRVNYNTLTNDLYKSIGLAFKVADSLLDDLKDKSALKFRKECHDSF